MKPILCLISILLLSFAFLKRVSRRRSKEHFTVFVKNSGNNIYAKGLTAKYYNEVSRGYVQVTPEELRGSHLSGFKDNLSEKCFALCGKDNDCDNWNYIKKIECNSCGMTSTTATDLPSDWRAVSDLSVDIMC